MGKHYETAYAKFSKKFGVDYQIEAEYDVASKLATLDEFTFNSTVDTKPQNAYKATLSSLLNDYLGKKFQMEGGKDYNTSDINFVEFVEEFDNVIDGILADKAEKEGTTYERKPYAGLSKNELAGTVWGRARGYNKPLTDVWAGQIRKGTLPIERLQNMTTAASNALEGVSAENAGEAEKKHLRDIVMAKNAMAEAKNQRSWISWLNPFNWGPHGRENNYLKELEGKINAYAAAGFAVDNVVPEDYGKNMLDRAGKELGDFVRSAAKTEAAPEANSEFANYERSNASGFEKNAETGEIEIKDIYEIDDKRESLDSDQLKADVEGKDVSAKIEKIEEINAPSKEKSLD